MKKLRMIVTSVIVLAIVSSAFAFTAKRVGSFCKSTTDQQDQNCAVVSGLQIETGTNNTFYKPNWNGSASDCNSCTSPIRLVAD